MTFPARRPGRRPPSQRLRLRSASLCAVLLLGAAPAAGGEPAPPRVQAATIQLPRPTGALDATIDLPDGAGPFPVVVQIAGSGPTDRDGNQPGLQNDSLKQFAHALAEHGVAVLRYDRRGIGKSAAVHPREETFVIELLADDAADWVRLLRRDRRFGRLGIVGHSEGSLVGILAARRVKVDALVALAGNGRKPADVLREQLRKNLPGDLKEKALHVADELEAGRKVPEPPPQLASLFRPSVQPFLISEFKYDPARELAALDLPVLIVQGTTDVQVTPEDARRLAAAKKGARLCLVEGMNHLLRHATTPAEQRQAYFTTSLPIEPKAIEETATFLKQALKAR